MSRFFGKAAEIVDSLLGRETVTAEPEELSVRFARSVLDDIRGNAGRLPAETGGMLGYMAEEGFIDLCHFDSLSRNSPGSFYYDVESMSEVYRRWEAEGSRACGIYHSHPGGCIRPSYHDVSTGIVHLRFFELERFYLPIIQSRPDGLYTMYVYCLRLEGERALLTLLRVIKATEGGYEALPFRRWQREYALGELDRYWEGSHPENRAEDREEEYFGKLEGLWNAEVCRKKVIVCVGVGGARSALENLARCGFRNFILMDADSVGESNIATQAVYISEMGRAKTEVLRERILDINPKARVVCVNRFLDGDFSDADFAALLARFPGREATDYLIMGCTDNFAAQRRSAALAQNLGIPYIAAMMYRGGAAAELIFTYPGVTPVCPRCLLRRRYELYEGGFENDVGSELCHIFATERMNALKGQIALMLLFYRCSPGSPYDRMLDGVKDRNFVWIRLSPRLGEELGIEFFDSLASGEVGRYMFTDETAWIPQHPDSPRWGESACLMCGGGGDLSALRGKWDDTREV